jgi:single-strand DNA-binding protein
MKKIIITGNVGKDPELRQNTTSDGQFATFTVAVSVGNKQNPKTDWVDVSCNGKLAEIVCAYVKKGSKVLVSGFPTAKAYINKENIPVATLLVYADDVEFLSAKETNSETPTSVDVTTQSHIPF